MFKSQKSLRFIVVGLAIIAVSTLAIAANWGTSYGFSLFAPNEATAPESGAVTNDAQSPARDVAPSGASAQERVPVFEARVTGDSARSAQGVTVTNLEDNGNIDMASLDIHALPATIPLRGSSAPSGRDGAAMGTGKAYLGITHEIVNQSTTNAFGTLSSGWTLGESVQFYLNGALAATFAASANGTVAVGISTGAGLATSRSTRSA